MSESKDKDLKKSTNTQEDFLLKAVKKNRVDEITRLCKKGVSPNLKDENDIPVLTLATKLNYPDSVEALLEEGADIDEVDKKGNTALMVASENNFESILYILLRFNPDINIKNNDKKTAIEKAASKGNKKIVDLLFQKGADPDSKDEIKRILKEVKKKDRKVDEELARLGLYGPTSYQWFKAIITGVISALIAGLSIGFGNYKIGFIAYILCYTFFIRMNKSKITNIAALALMIIIGSIIASFFQNNN